MNVEQTNFAKSHAFDKKFSGVHFYILSMIVHLSLVSQRADKTVVVNLDAPGIGGTLLPGQKPKVSHISRSITRAAASGMGETTQSEQQTPAYISFDRKVLCFFIYSQEGVSEARLETFRYRFLSFLRSFPIIFLQQV